jgi:hypothetical protein
LTNLLTTEAVAAVLPQMALPLAPVAELKTKPVQDRFAGGEIEPNPQAPKSTKTAEALVPAGGAAVAPAVK